MSCYACGTKLSFSQKPRREETCPNCHAYVHCCRNCRFYDPGAHNQCREPQAEWVKDKEMANFCAFFEFRGGGEKGSTRREEARKKLDELFKKK
ncbi:MAG: hypothetical protein D6743_12975 [Calditrichaeota bacterium]|nr:MAG: hypothetical protein D6743_12975 [Calditrichota bacterium]